MSTLARALASVCLAAAILVTPAQAQDAAGDNSPLADWNISGSNTAQAEHYNITGAEGASPYPFEGPQYFDDLYINFSRNFSPYNRVFGYGAGVLNQSDYRSTERTLTDEEVAVAFDGALRGLQDELGVEIR